MALVNCPECNNSVSSSAQMCPSCGFNVSLWIRNTEAQRQFQEAQARKNELKPKQSTYVGIVCVAFAACCCWPIAMNENGRQTSQTRANYATPPTPQPVPAVVENPYSVRITGVSSSEINGSAKAKKGNVFLSVHYEIQKNITSELDDPMVRSILKTKKKEWPNRNQTGAASYVPRMGAQDSILNSWITFEVPKKEIREPFKVSLDGQDNEINPSDITQ